MKELYENPISEIGIKYQFLANKIQKKINCWKKFQQLNFSCIADKIKEIEQNFKEISETAELPIPIKYQFLAN